MKNYCLVFLIFVIAPALNATPCTVFYAARGDAVLGGNNEDYSDPATGLFIIPAEDGKHGWLKMGFLGGYPQGGMNEKGLFYDATGCAYLPMPESEAGKQFIDGPIMQKIMEECGTVQEALDVLAEFYCEDQYRAQYLIGDASGASIIVEGDNIIVKDKHYQVLTNFYQSHPELGGHPCSRYDTAVAMLEESDDVTPYLFGAILSATHQEGRYPTQYSNIYDLSCKTVTVFHFHNYDEFIVVDLLEELGGARTYPLAPLFSQIELVNPTEGEEVDRASVSLEWRGWEESTYHVYCSTDPEFIGCEPIVVADGASASGRVLLACAASGLLGIAFIGGNRRRVCFIILFMMIASALSCGDNGVGPEDDDTFRFTTTLNNLQPGTAYYWKITATPQNGSPFTSETRVLTFKTSE